ncbi:hypothetical protein QBC44DRAFT_320795 [Cladorrhinum sp. PSN332]|nr:hypothetical protein QBC44DRAFT_320795 [Cladorrhinum sp. PSN332]
MHLPDNSKALVLATAMPAVLEQSHHSATLARRSPEKVDLTLLHPTIDDSKPGWQDKWFAPTKPKGDELTNMTLSEIRAEGPFAIPGAMYDKRPNWRVAIYALPLLIIGGLVCVMLCDIGLRIHRRLAERRQHRGPKVPKKYLEEDPVGDNGNVDVEKQAQNKPAVDPVIKKVPGIAGPTPVVAMKENPQGLPAAEDKTCGTSACGGTKSCCGGKGGSGENKTQKPDAKDYAESTSSDYNNSIFGDPQTRQNVRSMLVQGDNGDEIAKGLRAYSNQAVIGHGQSSATKLSGSTEADGTPDPGAAT